MEFATDRLIVRSPIMDDAADIFKNYSQDPKVTKYLTWQPHVALEQTTGWVSHCIQNAETPAGIILVVYHRDHRQAIGMLDFRFDGFKADFGYVLAKPYWNQGIMTEAMRPVIDYVAAKPEIYRIWAVHDVANGSSGKVMEKLGLKYEGILRRFIVHPNISAEPRDVKIYARVR